jgi:hypothetical protein
VYASARKKTIANIYSPLHKKQHSSIWTNYSTSITYQVAYSSDTLDLSVNDTVNLKLERNNFTYGEISLLSFPFLLQNANPKKGEVFYDLGCGVAKPSFYASFLYDFSKCKG